MSVKKSYFFIAALIGDILSQESVLTLGEISQSFKLEDKSFQYFQFDLSSAQDNDFLILKAFSLKQDQEIAAQKSDPDLYISKVNKEPHSFETSEWLCSTAGREVCTVPAKDVKKVYVGVRCYRKCIFRIFPQLIQPIELQDGSDVQATFVPYESKLFKFYLTNPRATENRDDPDQSVKSLSLSATRLGFKDSEDIILAVGSKGKMPSTATKRGIAGWKRGITLRVTDDNRDEWCMECWVHVLVDVTDPGLYSVVAKTNLGVQAIKNGETIDDVLFHKEKRQCYTYYIQNATTDLKVRLSLYSGFVSYALHPFEPPVNYDSALHRVENQHDSGFVLTAASRAPHFTGLYYLCVYPHLTSTYSLSVSELPHTRNFDIIQSNWAIVADVLTNQTKQYLLKVPKMDFEGEDIKITGTLTTLSGVERAMVSTNGIPIVIDQFDGQLQVRLEDIMGKQEMSVKIQQPGRPAQFTIDHNHKLCEGGGSKDQAGCYYLISVRGNFDAPPNTYTRFSLYVTHTQENHQVIQENSIITDYVEARMYKYYKYTMNYDPDISKVSVILNTLHGDADIYTSQIQRFPNISNGEQTSMKSYSSLQIEDHVSLALPTNSTQVVTYYIAIYSAQFSTYTLLVKPVRKTQTVPLPVTLLDGIRTKGDLRAVGNKDFYQIQMRQVEGYERQITIQVAPEVGNWCRIYLKAGGDPSYEDYTWFHEESSMVIKPSHPGYRINVPLYVKVLATTNQWQSRENKNFRYTITFSSQESFIYLSSNMFLSHWTQPGDYQQFRHYLTTLDSDMSVSVNYYAGMPTFQLSFNASDKNSSNKNSSYLLSHQYSKNSGLSNAYYIKAKDLSASCKTPELAQSLTEPCGLFIRANCPQESVECKYQIIVTYVNSAPQRITFGKPVNQIMLESTFQYYYAVLKKGKTERDIVIVLSSDKKNTDLYVSLQENPQKVPSQSWIRPDATEYMFRSNHFEGQDIITLSQDQLGQCFSSFDPQDLVASESTELCGLVIGVYSPKIVKGATFKVHATYRLIVYSDLVQLSSHSPFHATVGKGHFQYYLIESSCDDCAILLGVNSYSQGNPDVYIVYGDERLPTTTDYDIMSSTFRNELVHINLKNPFFVEKGLKSMRGPYIVGVYGVKKSNYTISFTLETQPIGIIMEGKAVKGTQEPFQTVHYIWYNTHSNKDFRIHLQVKKGMIDVYLGTFIEKNADHSLAQRLPKSKRDNTTFWYLENIRSTSAVSKSSMLVLNNEKNYCSECFYLIALITEELQTDFLLQLDVLDADFKNTQLMKIGEIYQSVLSAGERKYYRFILDDFQDFTVIQSASKDSEVKTLISFGEFGDPVQTVMEMSGSESLIIRKDDAEKFKLENIYYVEVLNGQVPCELSIEVTQDRTIHHMKDGIPKSLVYNGPHDISKFMVISLPGPNQKERVDENLKMSVTVHIHVKTFEEHFHPQLFVKFYEDVETQVKLLDFPPAGYAFDECFNWDYHLQLLFCVFNFETYTSQSGLALNLFEPQTMRSDISKVSQPRVQITVSTTNVVKLLPDQTFIGELQTDQSIQIYSIDDQMLKEQTGYLMFEFSECRGDTELLFLEDSHQVTHGSARNKSKGKQVPVKEQQTEFGRDYYFLKLPITSLLIHAQPAPISQQQRKELEDLGGPMNSFIIRTKHNQQPKIKNNQFYLGDNGRILYLRNISDDGSGKEYVTLSWKTLHYTNVRGHKQNPNDILFFVVISTDPQTKLDSNCAILAESNQQLFQTSNLEYSFQIDPETPSYFVNVFAKVKPLGEAEFEFIPYKSLQVRIKDQQPEVKGGENQISLLIIILVLTLLFLCGLSLYLRGRSTATAQRLETELTTVVRRDGAQTYTQEGDRRGKYPGVEGRAENGPGKGTAVRRQAAASSAGKGVDDEMNDSQQELRGESNQ